jgi:hypothetical protein
MKFSAALGIIMHLHGVLRLRVKSLPAGGGTAFNLPYQKDSLNQFKMPV